MSKQMYLEQKKMLEKNLSELLAKYSPNLNAGSDEAKALLAVIKNGKKMLDEIDIVYIGLLPSFITNDETKTEANYVTFSAFYEDANNVIECMLAKEVDSDKLTKAVNTFHNKMKEARTPISPQERGKAAFNAFSWALLMFAGLYLVAVSVCPPLALLTGAGVLGIGASIGYHLLGIVVGMMGFLGAVQTTMAALDRGRKSAYEFKDTLFSFIEKVHPAAAEQKADYVVGATSCNMTMP